jgi:Icc-related predicted phosphoesterase
MIVFVGDTHGDFGWFPKIMKDVPEDATVIQLGDFGFWPGYVKEAWHKAWKKLGRPNPIYAIDGNHEYFPILADITEPTEIWKGVIYVPRGTVLELDHAEGMKRVGFMGGASSIDYKYRTLGIDWFLEEGISTGDMMRMNDVDSVDILVTHTPPNSVIQKNFDRRTLLDFGLSPSWTDPSAVAIDELWDKLGNPPLICGHMHKSVVDGNCRMLDINEVWLYRPW